MALEHYMQPVAVHRTQPERLLLHDDQARWFLWTGEAESDPVEIPRMLGCYLMSRQELQVLEPRQRMWFVVADLPVQPVATSNPEVPEKEFFV